MQERRLATIMPVLQSQYKTGLTLRDQCNREHILRNLSECGFTNIVDYTALLESDEDQAFGVLLRENKNLCK